MEKGFKLGKVMILEAVFTMVFLCVFALILQKIRPSETTAAMGIRLLYVLVNLAGGIWIGKIMVQKKFLWGAAAGFIYFVVLSLISFLLHQSFYTDIHQAGMVCLLCMAGGMAGGMLA